MAMAESQPQPLDQDDGAALGAPGTATNATESSGAHVTEATVTASAGGHGV